jgi:hypothetical protein
VIGLVIASISVMLTAGAVIGGATALSAASGQNAQIARMEAAAAQLSASSAAASSVAASNAVAGENAKTVAAVDPARLKALLPDTVIGLPRTETSSTSVAPGGLGTSNAEAVYSQGAQRIDLTVTDISAMGAFAKLAGVTGMQSDSQTQSGYKRVGKINGRLTTEEWDSVAKSGKYGVLVADRVMVQAEGSGVTMDDLKSAVALVGPDRVEQIVKS